jgi:amidase
VPTFADFEQFDAVGLAALIRSGEVSPREVIDASIDRIELLNPGLNAVVSKIYDRALAELGNGLPDGPLAGVPFLLKNLSSELEGVPSTEGSRSLRWNVPGFTSTLVERFRHAGLVVLGKTNAPEFGLAPVTEPELHGTTRNPWDPEVTAGGSSGGSAAAVAAGMVPAAHASDGGGSIRIPASVCGLFGLKPTRGRTPSGPFRPEGWFGMSVAHALTRSVRDSAVILDAVHGPEPGDVSAAPSPARPFIEEVGSDPGSLRIGVLAGGVFHDDIDPECRAAVGATAELLHDLGHRVEGVELAVDRPGWRRAFLVLVAASTAQAVRDATALGGSERPDPDDFELSTWVLGLIGRRLTAVEFADAMLARGDAARMMGKVMEQFDVVVTPTLPSPPFPHGATRLAGADRLLLEGLKRAPAAAGLRAALDQLSERSLSCMPNTPLFNMTGQPAMSVPLHRSRAGLPIGVQFVARFGDEATLFRLASQLEEARPWQAVATPRTGREHE